MTNEFDPTMLEPNAELSDEQRLLLQQQDEQRAGDENEAKGFNRDGSPKTAPVVTPSTPATPSTKTQGPVSLNEIRSIPLGTGVRDAAPANTTLSEEALMVKQKLSKQPKLPIFLPLENGERKGISYRPVIINGYRFEVKKGIMVYVPQAVHDLLINAMQASAEATYVEENLSAADIEKQRALGLA